MSELEAETGQQGAERRLAVQIGPTTKGAIDRLMTRDGGTQTDAVRRLVRYGDAIYEAAEVDGLELYVRSGDRVERLVLIT